MVIKLENGRYAKDCPSCGKQQTYLRKNYAEASLKEGKRCKKCVGNDPTTNGPITYRGVRLSWVKKFETNAKLRGIDWEITVDDIADLYEEQEGLCALTGWPIVFPEVGHHQLTTVSIDRIDSSFGYLKENIQLVDKRVNMMKQSYSQEEFILVCKAVADKVKW
jgi:hypothetical protein